MVKYSEYKDQVDRTAATKVTSLEHKLKKGVRGPLLRFLIERESRADNVELAQVLEMVDDLLGQNLDPDLWNYGEAIRAAATGKTTHEQFLGKAGMGEDGEGAEAHQEGVERVQRVLDNYLVQFRTRRAQERVQVSQAGGL